LLTASSPDCGSGWRRRTCSSGRALNTAAHRVPPLRLPDETPAKGHRSSSWSPTTVSDRLRGRFGTGQALRRRPGRSRSALLRPRRTSHRPGLLDVGSTRSSAAGCRGGGGLCPAAGRLSRQRRAGSAADSPGADRFELGAALLE